MFNLPTLVWLELGLLDMLDLLFGRLVLFCLPLASLFACLLSLAYLVYLLALCSLLSLFALLYFFGLESALNR